MWLCAPEDAPGSATRPMLSSRGQCQVAKVLVNDWGYGQANGKGMATVDQSVLQEGVRRVQIRRQDAVQAPVPNELKQR